MVPGSRYRLRLGKRALNPGQIADRPPNPQCREPSGRGEEERDALAARLGSLTPEPSIHSRRQDGGQQRAGRSGTDAPAGEILSPIGRTVLQHVVRRDGILTASGSGGRRHPRIGSANSLRSVRHLSAQAALRCRFCTQVPCPLPHPKPFAITGSDRTESQTSYTFSRTMNRWTLCHDRSAKVCRSPSNGRRLPAIAVSDD